MVNYLSFFFLSGTFLVILLGSVYHTSYHIRFAAFYAIIVDFVT